MTRAAVLGAGVALLAAGVAALLLRPSAPEEVALPVTGDTDATPRLRGAGPDVPTTVGLPDDEVRATARSFLAAYGDEPRARLARLAKADARVAAALVDELRPEHDADPIRPDSPWLWPLESRLGWIRKILLDLGEPAVTALREALAARDEEVRVRVANTLRLFGADAAPAVPALVAALAAEGRSVYEGAPLLHALAAVGPEARDALPVALAVVADEGAPENVAVAAATAVMAIAGPGEVAFGAARTVLARRALGAGIEVLIALHQMGPKAAPMVPAVLRLLEETPDGPLAQHGLAALHAIASGDAKSIELLRAAVADEGRGDEYRQLSAQVLAAQGEAGRKVLLREAEVGGDEVRLFAFVALLPEEGNADEALVRMVLPAVRADDRDTSSRALQALAGRVAVAAWVLPTLRDVLRDDLPGVREAAVRVISGLPGPDAEAAAIAADLTVEGRSFQRAWALSALGVHAAAAPDVALAAFRRAYAERDVGIRYAAVDGATSLRFHRRPGVAALWADAAKDENASVRSLATQRLKDLGVTVPESGK